MPGTNILKINGIIYDDINRLFKVNIPPAMIPESIKKQAIENAKKVRGAKDDYGALGLDKNEITKRIKEFKKDNSIESLFAVFINVKSVSTVLSFIMKQDKKKLLKDPHRSQLMEETLNELAALFNKEIFVLPVSKSKTASSSVDNEVVETLTNNIMSLFEILQGLTTIMGDAEKFDMNFDNLETDDFTLIDQANSVVVNGVDKITGGDLIV